MKNIIRLMLATALTLPASIAFAMGEADPVITKLMLDKFETRITEGPDPMVWDASVYVGRDLMKFWLNSDGERAENETESSRVRAYMSRAISPYWNVTLGIRHDIKPNEDRGWAQLGLRGTAPYFIESELSLFIGDDNRSALELEFEKEIMLTQQWEMEPELEMIFYGHNDPATGVGSGLSKAELGLRFKYKIIRELAPYFGINWEKKFGNTADLITDKHDGSDFQAVIGIKAWY